MRPFPKGEQYPGFFERSNTGPARLRIRDNRDVRPPFERPLRCTQRYALTDCWAADLANALKRLQMNGW